MQYTITPATLRAIKRARATQTKAARKSFEERAALLTWKHDKRRLRYEYAARMISRLAHVHLVNGKTIACAVDVGRLVDWAKTTGAQSIAMTIEEKKPVTYTLCSRLGYRHTVTQATREETRLALSYEPAPGVRSKVYFNTFSELNDGKVKHPAADLGEPLRLVAPAEGGEFVFEGGAA